MAGNTAITLKLFKKVLKIFELVANYAHPVRRPCLALETQLLTLKASGYYAQNHEVNWEKLC